MNFSEREATVMRANSWLYHYYTVQTKLQYGLAYPAESSGSAQPPPSTPNPSVAAATRFAYFPNAPLIQHYAGGGGHGQPESSGYPPPPPPSINGNNYYHHHHPHAFEMPGKESPLDFSLGT